MEGFLEKMEELIEELETKFKLKAEVDGDSEMEMVVRIPFFGERLLPKDLKMVYEILEQVAENHPEVNIVIKELSWDGLFLILEPLYFPRPNLSP